MDIGSITPFASPPTTVPQGGSRLQAAALQTVESLDLTFTDPTGRSYHLSVQSETSLYSLTYDQQARLSSGADLSARGTHRGLTRQGRSPGPMLHEVDGFRRHLHRFLKAADRGYADHYRGRDPWEDGSRTFQGEHLSYLAATRTVTVSLEVTGTQPAGEEAGYWSVENTAARLRDFAVGLFQGGDRSAHAERMDNAMEAGYGQARAALGGALPDIARQTIDLAKKLLGQWADGAGESAPPAEEAALDLVA